MSDELKERLDDLKDQWQKTELDIVEKTKIRDTKKADITDLEKRLNEINQVKAAYEKVYDDLYKEKKGFIDYAATKKKIIDGALQESDKKQIDTKIENIDKEIEDGKILVKKLDDEYKLAKGKFEETKIKLSDKQKIFDGFKIHQNEIRDKLKTLKGFKDLIEKEPEDNFRNIYFQIKEFDKIEINLKDKDTFILDYLNSEKELYEAKSNCRSDEDEMNKAKNVLDIAQNNLESLTKDRNEKILSEISTINLNNSPNESDSSNKGRNKNTSSKNSNDEK